MLRNSNKKRILSVFSLVMINIIAVDSIRTLPMSAEYGFSLVFYYLLGGLIFFIPAALVSAELATGWPETGGLYVWVREAFGNKWGFITIWLQWIYNVCWYPTIMSLIAATLAYCIDPKLADNRFYMLSIVIIFFWGATLINMRGMKASSILSSLSAILGTLLPMIFIIILGIVWVALGKPIEINFTVKSFFPDMSNVQNLVLLTAILYGLIGMEMSAVHAQEVKNPQRDYPKALLYSTVIILGSLILSSLAVAIVVPREELNLVAGMMQAFDYFFTAFHMRWLMPVVALSIIIGAVGGVGAWIIGPTKGLLVASRDGSVSSSLSKTNQQDAPYIILILQGIIVTILSGAFLLMPSVSSAFWLLTDITAILSLLVYVAMFSAAIYLRFKRADVKRAFNIPGGRIGIIIVAGAGLITTIFAIIIGFIPPSQIAVGGIVKYELLLIGGVLVACLIPFLIYKRF